MSNLSNLLGLEYRDEKQDCFTLIRNYFRQEWGILLPNQARPSRFWEDPNIDPYGEYTRLTEFKTVMDGRYRIGDVVLMPIMSRIANHGGVIVGDNQLMHHLPNRLSGIDPFHSKWADRVTIHLRHPAVTAAQEEQKKVTQLHEVLDADILRNPTIQAEIERALGTGE